MGSGSTHTSSYQKLVGSCPVLNVNMANVSVPYLVVTGSMVSTITETFFFLQNFSHVSSKECEWLGLKAAHGLDIPYVGYFEVDVTVLGQCILS